jgi:hypothetical protein
MQKRPGTDNPRMASFAVLGLVVLGFFFLSILGTFVVRQYNGLFPEEEEKEPAYRKDAAEEKPETVGRNPYYKWFNGQCALFLPKEEPPPFAPIYQGMMSRFQAKFFEYTTDFFPFYKDFVQAGSVLRLTYNSKSILKTDGFYHSREPQVKVAGIARKVKNFQSLLDSLGIPFLFVMTPEMDSEESDANKIPFMRQLDSLGIWSLDLGKSHSFGKEDFFKTDHHWKLPTALLATQMIASEINRKLGLGIDTALFFRERFWEECLPHSFWGSFSQTLQLSDSSRDDFVYLWPRQETRYSIITESPIQEGSFQEVFLNRLPGEIPSNTTYDFYWNAFQKFLARNADSLAIPQTILVTGNSYGKPVAGYLSLAFKNTIHHTLAPMNACVVQATKPDLVVLIESPGDLLYKISSVLQPTINIHDYLVLEAF